MTNSNNKRKAYALSLLAISTLILSACNQETKETTEPTSQYYTLPQITAQYDAQEVQDFNSRRNQGQTNRYENLVIPNQLILRQPDNLPSSLFYDSGIEIAYPADGVKGIYLTAENVANAEDFNYLVDFVNRTDLNAMVIDFKDDYGNIISVNESDNPTVQSNTSAYLDYKEVLKVLEENNIYPIARIVTFKDHLYATEFPEHSFHDVYTGEIWEDGNGARFINPFSQEVWDYTLDIAIEAAKMGFKDIQFDYVRFPEGFESFEDTLDYDLGRFSAYQSDDPENYGEERVIAITQFLAYAKEQLAPYGVDVSADVFGYTAVAGNSPDVRGIGQNFARMAEEVDAISAMIYPSHWGTEFFGILYPDLNPFETIDEYMYSEESALANVQNDVISRPWIQDFTDMYSNPDGAWQYYGVEEVQEQVDALTKHGVNEFLLWNAAGVYTEGVDYTPYEETAQ
ncbi:putative glycoside hydrolase [Fundicoccus culcitae]|uniref:Glycoside hydrolase n=1 Tax=Fundicoccus culcitae TaxID=2969821 RepID=A0ABY5P701_9LACT|nr:putative glycoside hydrolase [Fundicoccus culcitae]UUX34517.1 putative glycoside hydrolase [Fundicoccus culcitae]